MFVAEGEPPAVEGEGFVAEFRRGVDVGERRPGGAGSPTAARRRGTAARSARRRRRLGPAAGRVDVADDPVVGDLDVVVRPEDEIAGQAANNFVQRVRLALPRTRNRVSGSPPTCLSSTSSVWSVELLLATITSQVTPAGMVALASERTCRRAGRAVPGANGHGNVHCTGPSVRRQAVGVRGTELWPDNRGFRLSCQGRLLRRGRAEGGRRRGEGKGPRGALAKPVAHSSTKLSSKH